MTAFVLIAAFLILLAISATLRHRLANWLGSTEGPVLGVLGMAILAASIIGLFEVELVPAVLFIGLVVAFAVAWIAEFAFLMRQPDDAFNGRNDKLIWAILLIVLPPVGVVAFWSFRRAHWSSDRKPEPVGSARDWF